MITGVLLAAWWYDRNMLIKLYAMMRAKALRVFMAGVRFYTGWHATNEMIRDGYHVDEVFLYEHTETSLREIDVLRFFRAEIVKETFSHEKSIELLKFIELCCDQNSNFSTVNKSARYELEVNYTFDHKKYRIVYDTEENSEIYFPIQSESEIRRRDVSQRGILSAIVVANPNDEDGIDIYDTLRLFAGPMEDFYASCPSYYKVTKRHLERGLNGLRLNELYIKILDINANCHIIAPATDRVCFDEDR